MVAKFVRQPEGENILDVAKMLIHEFLELSAVNVVKAKSMSRDEDGYGTIKILLENLRILLWFYRTNRYLVNMTKIMT